MYKKELDNLLKSKQLPKSMLFYGEEFYSNLYIKKTLPLITGSDNVLSYYYDEYDFNSAKNFISQPSLFGDINLLYIKGDKKIPKKEIDVLIDISNKSSISYFYYQFLGEDRIAKDVAKSFTKKKGGDFVRFFKPNINESISILSSYAKDIGLQIDNYALRELLNIHNSDISLSYSELDKLGLLNRKIQSSDIHEYVYGMGEISLDDFIFKLLSKEDIREEIHNLLETSGSDEIKILNAISNFISQLFMFHSYIKAHGSYDVKEILGYPLPNFLAQKRANLSIKIDLATYEKMLFTLLESEYSLKYEQNIEKDSLLYATLIKLQALL
jgi:DNA polymerase-3 subunit delta